MYFKLSLRGGQNPASATKKTSLLVILALAFQFSFAQEEISSSGFEDPEEIAVGNFHAENSSWADAAKGKLNRQNPNVSGSNISPGQKESVPNAEPEHSANLTAATPAQMRAEIPSWLFASLVFLLLLSILANLYIFWSRKVLVSQQMALMPEESLKQLSELKTQLKKNASVLYQQYQEKSDELELVKCLEQGIERRDQQISELESGSRNLVLRNHAKELIELSRAVAEILDEETIEQKDVLVIRKLLDAALMALGVEKFLPQPGLDVTELGDRISEYFEEVETENESLDCTIAEIVEAGYIVNGVSYDKVLRPAKVKIFRYKELSK